MGLLDAAASQQQRALDIDHTLYNNMSRRVAESTTRLATTQHAQGKSVEAVQNLYLSFGIYKQLTKEEFNDENAALDAAQTLVLIARVSRAAGQSAQAKSMMAYALRTIRSTLGDNHPGRVTPRHAKPSQAKSSQVKSLPTRCPSQTWRRCSTR